jgi:predicted RNase H-like nuclease (RuvC/YqgF family)
MEELARWINLLTVVLERQDERLTKQDEQLERLITLQGIANERLERQTQQLDRQDATQAGMSMTLVRLNTTMDEQTQALKQQTQVLDRLDNTLRQMIPPRDNGQEA